MWIRSNTMKFIELLKLIKDNFYTPVSVSAALSRDSDGGMKNFIDKK